MEKLKPLSDFFLAIEKDQRIGTTHIAIYAALLQYWKVKGFINPINAFRSEIMKIAKISAPYTYHKCVRELSEYGYITYLPTRQKNKASKIYILSEV